MSQVPPSGVNGPSRVRPQAGSASRGKHLADMGRREMVTAAKIHSGNGYGFRRIA